MFSILLRRTPDGVRGLKFYQKKSKSVASCRTPDGVRGLKYKREYDNFGKRKVALRMGCVD